MGIADNIPKDKVERVNSQIGVPDAAIISKEGDICVLVEVKLGGGLTNKQLKRHEGLFIESQSISEPIHCTWDEIIFFMKEQNQRLRGESYKVTNFLIEQFLAFCSINGLGSEKSKEYYFQCFPLQNRALVREIDEYINLKYSDKLLNHKSKGAGISYKRKNKTRFFAKIDSKRHALLLSFQNDNEGRKVQNEFQEQLIAKKKGNEHTSWQPAYHAWLDLKVNSLKINDIIPYINKAFNETQ